MNSTGDFITPDVTPPAGSNSHDRELLQSIVEVARAIFGAQASSLFLVDRRADELVFEAVSGRGEQFLIGTRFPATAGIAGWVAGSGEPMVVDNLSQHPSFARDLAESTRFVPQALMAAPVVYGAEVIGVLEVLDPAPQSRSSLSDLDLLTLFAKQAGTALRVVLDHREPRPGASDIGTPTGLALGPEGRQAGLQLLEALKELITVS